LFVYHCKFIYQEGDGSDLINHLTLPHFYACPKSGPGFPSSYAMDFLCLVIWGVM